MKMQRMMIVLAAALWGCEGYVDAEKVGEAGERLLDGRYETDTDHDFDETRVVCTQWCITVNLGVHTQTDVTGPGEEWRWTWEDPNLLPTAPGVTIDPGPPLTYEACSSEPFSLWLHVVADPFRRWQGGVVVNGLTQSIPVSDFDWYLPRPLVHRLFQDGTWQFHHFAVVAAECMEGLAPNEEVTLEPPPPIWWFLECPTTFVGAANAVLGVTPQPQLAR